jgi:outer membrane protein assembly factor BamA
MRRSLRAALALAAGLAFFPAPPVHAKKHPRAAARNPRRAEPPRIRRIRIIRRDIFDTKIPSENKKIFRFINALHITSKEKTIRGQLLFKEGDPYDADIAKESERALRNILKLRNVRVTPIPVNAKTVDLLVTTQETWTTEVILGFSGVGSNLNLNIGARERNLLGLGKSTSFFYKKTDGIVSRLFSYDDPRLLGTPLVLSADYEDRADGLIRSISVAKPFAATITRWSAGGSYSDDKHEVRVLDNTGTLVETLQAESSTMGGDVSFSAGSTTRRVLRPKFGYQRLQSDIFHTNPRSPVSQDLYHVFRVGVDTQRVNFITVNHIKQYDRDEDFSLGPTLSFTGGAARRKWVPTSNNANFFDGQFQAGTTYGPSHFGILTLGGHGKFQKNEWRAAALSADAEYYNHFQARQTLAVHLGWDAIVNPGPGDQLFLGGDTGLRGYRLNQFAGNKKVLANVENRFFVVDDLGRLASLGWVVFADAGTVWAPGHDMSLSAAKVDVGTGMRLYLNRTSVGHVLRFDLAYAVKRVGLQKRLVFTFGTSHAF